MRLGCDTVLEKQIYHQPRICHCFSKFSLYHLLLLIRYIKMQNSSQPRMRLRCFSLQYFVGCFMFGALNSSNMSTTLLPISNTVILGDPAMFMCCSNEGVSEYRLRFFSTNADLTGASKLLCDTLYPDKCGRYMSHKLVNPQCCSFTIRQTAEEDRGTYICYVDGSSASANLHVMEKLTSSNIYLFETSSSHLTTPSSDIRRIATTSSLQSFFTIVSSTVKAQNSSASSNNNGFIGLVITVFVLVFVVICFVIYLIYKKCIKRRKLSLNGKRKLSTKDEMEIRLDSAKSRGVEEPLLKNVGNSGRASTSTNGGEDHLKSEDTSNKRVTRPSQEPVARREKSAHLSGKLSVSYIAFADIECHAVPNNSQTDNPTKEIQITDAAWVCEKAKEQIAYERATTKKKKVPTATLR